MALADGMWVDVDEELEEEIETSDCYVCLPNQYEIHEWNIMPTALWLCVRLQKTGVRIIKSHT